MKKCCLLLSRPFVKEEKENPRFGFGSLLPLPPGLLAPYGMKGIKWAESRRIRRARFIPPTSPLLSFRLRADEGRKAPSTGVESWVFFIFPLNLFAVLSSLLLSLNTRYTRITVAALSVAGIFSNRISFRFLCVEEEKEAKRGGLVVVHRQRSARVGTRRQNH